MIVSSNFSRISLHASIAQKITDQELNRLAYGAISLSSLSDGGIDSIEVRQEPVRRLRQSREVKCGRKLIGDVDHGRYMEYLAEFSDGSTFWIPSRNVATDLKEEFWSVMTTDAKEVTEVIGSDAKTGTVTIKRPDGSTETINQAMVFWQQEETPTRLSDAELEALLHHGHFGVDFGDFIPCSLHINTDWANVKIISKGMAIMKNPSADKAGEYKGVQFDERSIQVGQEHTNSFVKKSIPYVGISSYQT